jgi:lipid-binding SYLF domain-containing protein
MITIKKNVGLTSLLLGMVTALILVAPAQAGKSKEEMELERQARVALTKLYADNGAARHLKTRAKAILTFPSVIKVGFLGGIQVGTGVLMDLEGKTLGYYNTTAGSFGYQAGIKGFNYTLFLMNNKAIKRLTSSGGLALGTGPSLVVADKSFATGFTTTTLDKDIYAFIYDSKGAFGGAGIEGTKITKIKQPVAD